MRLQLRERPWDLILVLLYTIVASLVILLLGQGVLWALLLVIFSPGYVLVAALFPSQGLLSRLRKLVAEGEQLRSAARSMRVDMEPYKGALARARDATEKGRVSEAIGILQDGNERLRSRLQDRSARNSKARSVVLPPSDRDEKGRGEIDWVERIALSFGLSIAIVSLLGLLLHFTPWGIRLESISVTLLLFTLLVGLAAYSRRVQLPVEDRLSATVEVTWPAWRDYSTLDKALTVGLAASVVFAAGTLGYVIVTPRPGEQFTQFFILDRNGTADPELYPSRLNVSEPGTVIIGVVNNESARVAYAIRIDLVGVEIVQNGTSGFNETIELNRTTLDTFEVTLNDRTAWEQPYTFAIEASGLWKVEFLLFREGNLAESYQHVHLIVQVDVPT